MTFHFIRQCFTREDFEELQTRHCTICALRLEKLKLSNVDRLLLEYTGCSFCAKNSTVPVEKCSGPDIL